MLGSRTVRVVACAGALLAACSTDGLLVGVQSSGGSTGGGGGPSGFPSASPAPVFSVHVEYAGTATHSVGLPCHGGCLDLVIVAAGGVAPYHYSWEDGSTSAVRRVCPIATTLYTASVTDSAGSAGELQGMPQRASASLNAIVAPCAETGAGAGGAPAVPDAGPSSTRDAGRPIGPVSDAGCASATDVTAIGMQHYVGKMTCQQVQVLSFATGQTFSLDLHLAPDGATARQTGSFFFQLDGAPIGGSGTLASSGLACHSGGLEASFDGAWGLIINYPTPQSFSNSGVVSGHFSIADVAPDRISGTLTWLAGPLSGTVGAMSPCTGTYTASRQ
jgi:hypothetical protein